ncbi:MAG: triose-phosphate isomerase [Acidobacteriaceae bacterium]
MPRPKLIAANWKMYKNCSQARQFIHEFLPLIRPHEKDEIVLCVPFPLLETCANAVRSSPVSIGAQDLFWHKEGAWTGEVSADMLVEVGTRYVIVGHSERRQHFNETNAIVNLKLKAALAAGLHPIVCVGEVLEEREAGSTDWVLKRQYLECFEGIEALPMANCSIAYEPVWAIGTGRTATPEIAADAHRLIRHEVEKQFGESVAQAFRIVYGGSVKPENAHALMSVPEIDGALVGGASLDPKSLAQIVNW